MSEEALEIQEQQRRRSEERLKALREGEPLPGSLKEFMQKYSGELAENPLLKEFLGRLYNGYGEWVEALRGLVTEQNLDVARLNGEVADLRDKLKATNDNFSFFMSKMLRNSDERLKLVRHAVQTIDAAIEG